jgi:agmatinase
MATRKEIIATFDPSGVGLDNGNLYGLPFDYDSAQIIIFGVPWEATVSYHAGTADGPDAVLQASPQLDLYDFDNPDRWCRAFITSPWETGCGPSATRPANWRPR